MKRERRRPESRRPEDPTTPLRTPLSLSLSLSLSTASLSHRRPTTWHCRRPARVTGERRGRAVPSPTRPSRSPNHRKLAISHLLTPTRRLPPEPADTCRKPTPHRRPSLLYKLGAKSDPKPPRSTTRPQLGFGNHWVSG